MIKFRNIEQYIICNIVSDDEKEEITSYFSYFQDSNCCENEAWH